VTTETVLPDAPIVDAGADGQQTADLNAETTKPEGEEAKPEGEAKKEKTHEEREIARLRRRVDNLTRQKYEMQSRATTPLHESENTRDNAQQQADSDELKLTRADLNALIKKEAERLAPSIKQQAAEEEHRAKAVSGLVKEWGADKFRELTDDLAAVFGSNKQLAVLETDNPRAVIEYLTDPDNADEADAIEAMSEFKAGRAIAAIERKLSEAKPKPQASNAPRPIEPVRGQGGASKDPANMTDAEFAAMRRKQIAARR